VSTEVASACEEADAAPVATGCSAEVNPTNLSGVSFAGTPPIPATSEDLAPQAGTAKIAGGPQDETEQLRERVRLLEQQLLDKTRCLGQTRDYLSQFVSMLGSQQPAAGESGSCEPQLLIPPPLPGLAGSSAFPLVRDAPVVPSALPNPCSVPELASSVAPVASPSPAYAVEGIQTNASVGASSENAMESTLQQSGEPIQSQTTENLTTEGTQEAQTESRVVSASPQARHPSAARDRSSMRSPSRVLQTSASGNIPVSSMVMGTTSTVQVGSMPSAGCSTMPALSTSTEVTANPTVAGFRTPRTTSLQSGQQIRSRRSDPSQSAPSAPMSPVLVTRPVQPMLGESRPAQVQQSWVYTSVNQNSRVSGTVSPQAAGTTSSAGVSVTALSHSVALSPPSPHLPSRPCPVRSAQRVPP